MGRKTRRAAKRPEALEQATPAARDWALAGVALLGMALTALLLWSADTEGLPYCAAGSDCDVVQGSAWSRFLGLPLALWGFGLYLLIAIVALGVGTAARRWRVLAVLSTLGFVTSLYLGLISWLVIGATCPYCVASLALLAIAFVLSVRKRPAGCGWRAHGAGAAAAGVLMLAMHGDASGLFGPGGAPDPALRALAAHLEARGARFYGASWCPHCQDQKALFGAAASALPYVECAPHGPRGPRATACELAEIERYPTWIIDGRRIERLLTPEMLARLSAYEMPGSAP